MTDAEETSLWMRIHTWLSHPLLLLLAGAIVTGVLVPSFTNRWQRNQTAQEMKTQVIGTVTTTVSKPMTQLSITQNPVFGAGRSAGGANNPAITGTYATFLSDSDSVDSEIRAYFPDANTPVHWENLSGLIQNFYLLTYATDPQLRAQLAASIHGYFAEHNTAGGIDWNLLARGHVGVPGYFKTWQSVKRLIIGVKSIVLQGIMDAPSPAF
jgi:hypothetical protein